MSGAFGDADALGGLHALGRAFVEDRPDCAAFHHVWRGSWAEAPVPTFGYGPGDDVIAHLREIEALASEETRLLAEALIAAAGALGWRKPYGPEIVTGRGFFEGAAACALCGPLSPYPVETGRGGFFFIRGGVEYGAHRHEPLEIYRIVAGRGRFWTESAGWIEAGPGDVVHMPVWDWHAMATPDGPVVVLWSWVGEGLDVRPVMRDDGGVLPL